MGIDHFLDMGRTATNVLGNGIATGVVAKWENAIGAEEEAEEETALSAPFPVPAAAE
jgi:Na+/H+-dicarboxylate symporter